ncbi:MAG: NUDIX domain-containing protein [Christensenellales bacterium]
MEVLKAGCVLANQENKCIGLIYRDYLNDFSFPKGHLEEGEDFLTCAIRETAEETKRVANVLLDFEPYIERYTTSKGEECVCYLYLALDGGASDNDSTDTHDLIWVPVEEVEEKLTYSDLKSIWNKVFKIKVLELFQNNN